METFESTEEGIKLPPVDREEFELPSSAFGAKVKLNKDGNPVTVTIPKENILPFAEPGKRVGAKRLYTVKAVKPDGSVTQIPFEAQINNNVASPENALGLQYYVRKGFMVLFDFGSGTGAFCPTWDCWAKWNPEFGGFCCLAHKEITAPESESGPGFGEGSTTSSIWKS